MEAWSGVGSGSKEGDKEKDRMMEKLRRFEGAGMRTVSTRTAEEYRCLPPCAGLEEV